MAAEPSEGLTPLDIERLLEVSGGCVSVSVLRSVLGVGRPDFDRVLAVAEYKGVISVQHQVVLLSTEGQSPTAVSSDLRPQITADRIRQGNLRLQYFHSVGRSLVDDVCGLRQLRHEYDAMCDNNQTIEQEARETDHTIDRWSGQISRWKGQLYPPVDKIRRYYGYIREYRSKSDALLKKQIAVQLGLRQMQVQTEQAINMACKAEDLGVYRDVDDATALTFVALGTQGGLRRLISIAELCQAMAGYLKTDCRLIVFTEAFDTDVVSLMLEHAIQCALPAKGSSRLSEFRVIGVRRDK